jgi:hypothetical protein
MPATQPHKKFIEVVKTTQEDKYLERWPTRFLPGLAVGDLIFL